MDDTVWWYEQSIVDALGEAGLGVVSILRRLEEATLDQLVALAAAEARQRPGAFGWKRRAVRQQTQAAAIAAVERRGEHARHALAAAQNGALNFVVRAGDCEIDHAEALAFHEGRLRGPERSRTLTWLRAARQAVDAAATAAMTAVAAAAAGNDLSPPDRAVLLSPWESVFGPLWHADPSTLRDRSPTEAVLGSLADSVLAFLAELSAVLSEDLRTIMCRAPAATVAAWCDDPAAVADAAKELANPEPKPLSMGPYTGWRVSSARWADEMIYAAKKGRPVTDALRTTPGVSAALLDGLDAADAAARHVGANPDHISLPVEGAVRAALANADLEHLFPKEGAHIALAASLHARAILCARDLASREQSVLSAGWEAAAGKVPHKRQPRSSPYGT